MIVNPTRLELTPIISLDLETTGLRSWCDKIDLIAIKTDNHEYVLEYDKYTPDYLKSIFLQIAQCDVVILHNAKFDVGFIFTHTGVLLKNIHCTEMSAEMCENGKQKQLRKQYEKIGRPFSLVSVLHRWLGVSHSHAETKKIWQKSFIDPVKSPLYKLIPHVRNKQMEYAMEDVRHLRQLYELEIRRIGELELWTIYKLEHKLLPVIVKMETKGCLIDKASWYKLIVDHWEPEKTQIEKKLDEEVTRLLKGKTFKYSVVRDKRSNTQFDLFGAHVTSEIGGDNELNYGSSDQLIELITFLGEKVPCDEQGKESLEEEGLLVYLTENGDSKLGKFIEILLEHRKISKMISTYGYKFLAKLDMNDHIHTEYTQTKTETGRLSSKNPNLQNIPAAPKDDINKDIRRFFIAGPGCKFITSDMKAAEVRIAADYSQEPILLSSLIEGVDMHSILASISFGIIFDTEIKMVKSDADIVTINDSEVLQINGKVYNAEELRGAHKSVVFAKFYKGGAKRVYGVLSKWINTHWESGDRIRIAKDISDALDKKMPKLSDYLSKLILKAQKQGYLRGSSFGRIRFFEPTAYGEPANFGVQNTNAEAMKMAMINLDRYLDETGYGRLVMTVHDEILVEVLDGHEEEVAKVVKEIMTNSLSYFLKTIKGGASVSISTHWKK